MNIVRRGSWLLAVALVMSLLAIRPTPARAGIADAPGTDLQVSLITYGPGKVYWERFGHDAIEIRDRASGQAINFNYGVFDFNQKNFLIHFARGYPRYRIAAERSTPEMESYIGIGRSVRRQRLALTPAQAAQLRDFLLWNLRPQHRQYVYNYYTRNCATRVRDAIDRVLEGQLKPQLQGAAEGLTYRGETDRLLAAQPWMMLGIDLGLSGYADRPLDQWQAAFIPMQLRRELRHVRIPDGHGDSRPLVASHQLVAGARLPAPPSTPPNLIPPLLTAGLVLGLLLLASGHYRDRFRAARIGFGVLGTAWLLFAGLVGITLAGIWAFTHNVAGWGNENLLLFNPLALLLLPAAWRLARSRFSRWLLVALVSAAAFALLAKILPGFDQRNLPWISFALPPWAALLGVLWRRPQPVCPAAKIRDPEVVSR